MSETETKWPPGPWRAGISGRAAYAEHGEDGQLEVAIIPSADFDAAVVYSKKPRLQDPEPIAHLIAAAPELYDALDAIVSQISAMQAIGDKTRLDGSTYLTKARAALAKARGEA